MGGAGSGRLPAEVGGHKFGPDDLQKNLVVIFKYIQKYTKSLMVAAEGNQADAFDFETVSMVTKAVETYLKFAAVIDRQHRGVSGPLKDDDGTRGDKDYLGDLRKE